MEQRVTFSQLECTPDGPVQVRLMKTVLVGDKVLVQEPHRFVVEPGASVESLVAAVNAHLSEMGWPGMDANSVERVTRIVAVEHTADVVASYEKRKKAAVEAAVKQAQGHRAA